MFPPSRLLGREDLICDDDEIDVEVDIQEEEQTKKEVKARADMLEARRRLGYCAGLREIPEHALISCSVDEKVKILRAILPTIEELVFANGALDDQDCAQLADLIESEHLSAPKMTTQHLHFAFSSSAVLCNFFNPWRPICQRLRMCSIFESNRRVLTRNAVPVLTSMLKYPAGP